MKIKSLVSLLADAAPPSCPTSRTHPELAFNTSVRTIFGKMVKNTASKKSIKNQSFIKLEPKIFQLTFIMLGQIIYHWLRSCLNFN